MTYKAKELGYDSQIILAGRRINDDMGRYVAENVVKNLIKVVSPEVAEQLAKLGFQYIKEGSVFAFIQTDELMSVLQQTYSNGAFICENKLRF